MEGDMVAVRLMPLVLSVLFFIVACNPSKRVDLLILGGTVVTMDKTNKIIADGGIAIDDGRIVFVGRRSEVESRYSGKRELLVKNKLVIPGLINTHSHLPMALMRGISDDKDLMDWLKNYIFPIEGKLVSPDFVYYGTLLAAMEMISSGTTTALDMYYFEHKVGEALEKIGMRGVIAQTVIGFKAPDFNTPEATLEYIPELYKRFKDSELIKIAVAPHAPYTVSKEVLIESKRLADSLGVLYTIHLAETKKEVEYTLKNYGLTPVRFMDSIGVLGKNVLAAHCVWLDDAEIRLLKDSGVSVAHNPESNMELASGIAPIYKMLKEGVNVAIATDGPVSNNDLDLFEEARVASFLQKVSTLNPKALPANEVFRMITVNAAKALMMENEIGSIEKGKKADIVIIDTNSPKMMPLYNIFSHLVYVASGCDVYATIIDGKIIYKNGRFFTVNKRRILRIVRKYQEKIKGLLGF